MNGIYECGILLVDDNGELCRMVSDILKREGFMKVETAGTCRDADRAIHDKGADLVILDINLPDGDGFSLMRNIRTFSDIPVLFLSARDEDNDKLLGLGLGADDYITKPFLPGELLLRIKAILKRTYFTPMRQDTDKGLLCLGGRTVDFNSATVTGGGQAALTAKELLLLKKLADNRGNIVTFDILCRTVWGDAYYGYENTLMVHIRRLREKIEENPSAPRYLLTVRGLGYKLAKE